MNTKTPLIVFVLFVAAALAPGAAEAGGKQELIEKFLEQQNRPSVREVVEIYGIPSRRARNPMEKFGYVSGKKVQDNVRRWLPKAIARLELAFPNGIYAPMGRDSAAVGDVLEAFYYLQLGQTDRVSRVNASGNTINALNWSDLARLLESVGAVLDVSKPSPRTLVLLDATNYNSGSQSSTLLMAAAQAVFASGGNGSDVIERINFVSTARAMHRGVSITGREQVARMKRKQAESIVRADDRPVVIPAMGLSFLNYTAEWHGRFGNTLAQQADGRLGGYLDPNEYNHSYKYRSGRIQVLGAIFDFLRITSDPEFVADVIQGARELGFEFPLSGPRVPECGSILENAA